MSQRFNLLKYSPCDRFPLLFPLRISLNVSLANNLYTGGYSELLFTHSTQEFIESLQISKELNLKITGITLTRNNKLKDNLPLEAVFKRAKELVMLAETVGFTIETLTIPEVIEDLSLDSLTEGLLKMQRLFEETFPDQPQLRLFCETYDSLTTASLTICVTIQAVRRIIDEASGEEKVQYFVDDGQFNSFRKVPRCLRYSQVGYIRRGQLGVQGSRKYPTEVYGPSCDGNDLIVNNRPMPELSNGDLIYFTNVGSDTTSARTSFNGFLNCRSFHFMRRGNLDNEREE